MDYFDKIKSYIGPDHYLLSEIERIHKITKDIPFDEFFEPVSVIEQFNKHRKLVNFTPEIINAWMRHVYYSSKIRMVNFECAALSELSNSRLLTAMPLIRCHMEASGMACLCESELRKLVQTSNEEPLRKLIPSTFLGTSLIRAQKKDEDLIGQLALTEQDKVSVGQMISALDDFMTLGNSEGKVHTYYGLLCEYTHPNLRVVRDHTETKDHPVEGWYHRYYMDAQLTSGHFQMSLDMLLLSMKAGHGICETLNKMKFKYEHDRAVLLLPTESELREIWDKYLKYENENNL